MTFRFIFVTLAFLAATANGGVIGPITYSAPIVAKVANPAVDAVASTHQNVVRSFAGTISQYSKTIDTPYSSVRKEDTRISNNVYTPANAKTITYATATAPTATAKVYSSHQKAHAPAAAASVTSIYEHHEPSHVFATDENVHQETANAYADHANSQHFPLTYHHEAAPKVATAVYTPIASKTITYAAPETTHVAQQSYHHQAPAIATTTFNHGPDASTYSHNAPGIAAYGTSQTVRYSPAEMVSHMSFDGFGTHWGF